MGQNNFPNERSMYVKQIIQMSEESKKTLTLPASIILDKTITDTQLGQMIRDQYTTKLKGIEEHVNYMKSL